MRTGDSETTSLVRVVNSHRPSRWEILLDSRARFGEVVPEMRRPWCAALIWGGTSVGSIACLWFGSVAAQHMPHGAIFVEAALLLWAGAWMFLGFWRHRVTYRERYGSDAYRHLFFRFLIPFMVGGIAAVCFPAFVGGPALLQPVIAYSAAAYWLVTTALLETRGREIFWDMEWRGFVYNVFPERGRVVTAGIFGWLRHPVYSAAVRLALGLGLMRNNLSAVMCAGLVAIGVWVLGSVEERGLVRHDSGYGVYRRAVPAFFSSHPVRFWQYLVTGRG